MSEKASGEQSLSGQDKGLHFLEPNKQLNYDKGIGRKHPFHEIQQTSLEAYLDMRYSGELGERQEQVLQAFRDFGDHTALEMVELLGLPINCVTGRINELVHKFGLLEEKGEKIQFTRRRAIIWGITQYHAPPNPFRDVLGYYTKTQLLERGWTPGTIDQFLNEPDNVEENPHAAFGAPMPLYRKARVLNAERQEEYRACLKPKKVGV